MAANNSRACDKCKNSKRCPQSVCVRTCERMRQHTQDGRQKEESIPNPEDVSAQFFDLFTEIPASLNQKWCRERVLELPGLGIKPYIKDAQAHTPAAAAAGRVRTHTSTYRWRQFVLGCLISDVLLLKLKDNTVSTGPHFCVSREGGEGRTPGPAGPIYHLKISPNIPLSITWQPSDTYLQHRKKSAPKRLRGTNNLNQQQIKSRTQTKMVGCTHQYKLV